MTLLGLTHGRRAAALLWVKFLIKILSTQEFTATHACHLWQAPLGVLSAKRGHQSPEWMILSHVNCFIQGDVIGFQVLLDSLHPRSTRAPW